MVLEVWEHPFLSWLLFDHFNAQGCDFYDYLILRNSFHVPPNSDISMYVQSDQFSNGYICSHVLVSKFWEVAEFDTQFYFGIQHSNVYVLPHKVSCHRTNLVIYVRNSYNYSKHGHGVWFLKVISPYWFCHNKFLTEWFSHKHPQKALGGNYIKWMSENDWFVKLNQV